MALESAWKARLEEKVVQECSGRGKVGIWVPGERPGRGQGEGQSSYFGGPHGSALISWPMPRAFLSNKETRKPDSHSLVTP